MSAPLPYVPNHNAIQAAMDGPSYPNPNVQGNPYIYLAVYSSVPVYEMMVRGIGVMRRRVDSWLNATQILKVAGVDKGKRTKILEKDIAQGVHEKVQGGYGRYQGTWIPFERSVELANAYGVSHLLAPLFDYTAPPPPVSLNGAPPPPAIQNHYALATPLPPPSMQQAPPMQMPSQPLPPPPPPQDTNAILQHARQQGLLPTATPPQPPIMAGPSGLKRMSDSFEQEDIKRVRLDQSMGSMNGYGAAPLPLPARQHQAPTPVAPPVAAKPPSNYRTTLSFSVKPPADFASKDPMLLDRDRSALKSVFAVEAEQTAGNPAATLDLSTFFPPDLDANTPIDEQIHTALHWASALARVALVRALVAAGADINRGNHVGETPLIRAILVTNNSDQDTFLHLLEVLGPSLRTVDDTGRSILHHAAVVAGVKGRAVSARYYLETVLEYVARQEGGISTGFVDAQDQYGDTALNIAARVGNKQLVKALLEAGADKMKPNKLGLRATDYGVDVEALAVTPSEDISRAFPLLSEVPRQASHDVVQAINHAITSLTSSFETEASTKTSLLDEKRQQVSDATRQLADLRREQAHWTNEANATEDQAQRVKNLQNALDVEDAFDWTGRTEADGSPASALAGPGFTYRGPGSTLSGMPSGINLDFDADPPVPDTENGVTGETLVHLLRLQAWYERVEGLMRQRVERLEDGNGELDKKLRKMVASFKGVEEDKVDDMLDDMISAFEHDTQNTEDHMNGFISQAAEASHA
ncbi:hypothetical protein JCM11641_004690 [Rhodosporidiobolus odoratus]